jgi:hypothetical protein
MTSSSSGRVFGRLVGGLKGKKEDKRDDPLSSDSDGDGGTSDANGIGTGVDNGEPNNERSERERSPNGDDPSKQRKKRGEGFVHRMRSLSRSRKRSTSASRKAKDPAAPSPETVVTVTSCRSDGYYNQKAPGSTTKLPRKAPSNLKLFHELAVGLKDAYAAVGQTPVKPLTEEEGGDYMPQEEFEARMVLWEFIGNIDFVSNSINQSQFVKVSSKSQLEMVSQRITSSASCFGRRSCCRHCNTRSLERRYYF